MDFWGFFLQKPKKTCFFFEAIFQPCNCCHTNSKLVTCRYRYTGIVNVRASLQICEVELLYYICFVEEVNKIKISVSNIILYWKSDIFANMAEFVQQSIEEMVGELHEMQTAGLFDGSEIRYNQFSCENSRGWLNTSDNA